MSTLTPLSILSLVLSWKRDVDVHEYFNPETGKIIPKESLLTEGWNYHRQKII